MYNRKAITGSEQTNDLKSNVNYTPLRGIVGTGDQANGYFGPLVQMFNVLSATQQHIIIKKQLSEFLEMRG